MGIITKYDNNIIEDNSLNLDFRKMSSAIVHFEIALDNGITEEQCKDIQWVLYQNDKRVDDEDYTGGQKAELILYKDQAGAVDFPSTILIHALKPDDSIIDSVTINLFDESEITEAVWLSTKNYQEITEADFNETVELKVDGKGIFGINLNVEIFLSKDNHKLDSFILIKDRTIDRVKLKKEWNTEKSNCFFAKEEVYFVVSYNGEKGKTILFNGKEQGKLLVINGNCFTSPEPPATGLMTVMIRDNEQYFTQRHELCKYKTIKYKFGSQDEIILFDEKEQPVKNPYKQPSANIMVGAHKKPFKISVTGHEPKSKCSAVEKGDKAHTTRIIDTTEIDEANITTYDGANLEFTPYYPYKYHSKTGVADTDYLNFLGDYFIPPVTTELTIPIETCRYRKNIRLKIIPDVAWALHFQLMLDPSQLENKPDELKIADKKDMYFREISEIKLHIGIKEMAEKYKETILKYMSYISIVPSPIMVLPFNKDLNSFIFEMIYDYIYTIGNHMGIGLHGYYNEDGTTRKILDYTARYPQIGNVIFSSIILILVIADILILIFSGGSSAAARLGLKASIKGVKVAKKVQKLQDRHQWIQRKTEHSVFDIAFPIITRSIGKGYKIYSDGSSGYNYELKLSANPLFGLIAKFDGHTGDLILGATGISNLFSITRTVIGFWGKFKILKRFKNNKNLANRTFKMKRNAGSGLLTSSSVAAKALHKKGPRAFITPGDIIVILNKAEKNLAEKARKIAKELGQELKYYLSVEGVYKAQFKVDFNFPDDGAPILEMKNKLPNGEVRTSSLENNEKTVSFSRKKSIDVYAFMKVSSKLTFTTDWIEPYIPEWLGAKVEDYISKDAKINAKGEAMLMGGISFERKYGIDNDLNPYSQDITHFSGIAGRYSYLLKKDEGEKTDWQNEEENNTNFELKGENPQLVILKPFDIEGEKVYLFKKDDIIKGL
ncbi:MAG: hypothetical protein JKY08_06085 [Flavobacteriaceae bacterium]|nr:hypothetical protein [Flavobacteriaceae bacterium]